MAAVTNPWEETNFRYASLANEIEKKINEGVYKVGEKLPSLRKLHRRTGLSISTVYHAYIELEKRGIIEPREKSGYYVKPVIHQLPAVTKPESLRVVPKRVAINSLANSIIESMSDPAILQLGGATLSEALIPYKQLVRSIKSKSMENAKALFTTYTSPAGIPEIRREIAKRTIGLSQRLTLDEIVITNGCMEAVNICLRAVARAGDTILVESPTFHCFLQLIEELNMFVLELPTDPRHGLDLQRLKTAIVRNTVKACILNPTIHNPVGYIMPEPAKKELVQMLNQANIPIIEDDVCSELYFGKKRPGTLKSYDQKGLVLYCTSFSKSLVPGLRVGWTLPGKFKEAVKRLKVNTSIASPQLTQYIIADFLKSGSYERHLRRTRIVLQNQVSNMALAVSRHFPQGTKLSVPQGGLVLWAALPETVDGLEVFYEAMRNKISIFPGVIFSTTKGYSHYIRINCSFPWNDRVERGVRILGDIIKRLMKRASPR